MVSRLAKEIQFGAPERVPFGSRLSFLLHQLVFNCTYKPTCELDEAIKCEKKDQFH